MATGILIYEDNPSLRESLNTLLTISQSYTVLGAFDECSKVSEQVQLHKPEVILMDIDLPGISGIEGVKQVRKINKEVQIIMLTVFDDNTHVYDALYAGANGYLLKKYISDKLVNAIEDVLQGGAPMSPSIARMVISHMHESNTGKDYQLTAREKEILQSLSKGNSFKLIAAEYGISLETVRTHIKHIYDKLHVQSQIEAVSKAITERLI
jgi:DNA-binding NarL/FixJ family response regulator